MLMCSLRSSRLSESKHSHASELHWLDLRRQGGREGALEGEGVSSECLAPMPRPCPRAQSRLSDQPSAWCVQILLRLRPARALPGWAEGQGGRDDGLAATSAGIAASGDAASSADGAQAHLALASSATAVKPACSPVQGQPHLRGGGSDVRGLGREGVLRRVRAPKGRGVAARDL